MRSDLIRNIPRKLSISLLFCVASLTIISCVPMPAGSGGACAGSVSQGWSGFSSYNGIIYFGSMDGKVVAVNPSARSQGLNFPSEGEWSHSIATPAPSGSLCGPTCAPSAPGVKIYGTPSVGNDLVYVGTYNGKIIALNAVTGALRWVYPREGYQTIGAVVGNIIADDDTIYISSSNGKVYALDTVTGDWKWEFETESKIWTSPTVSDGVLYVSNYDRKLYALSSQDGDLLWETELSAVVASSPVVYGADIFLGTFDRYLYAISKASGEIKWKFEGENWFWATPLVKDGVIYASCLDHKLYALESRTGKELWSFVADSPIVSAPLLIDGLIITISDSGEMYILNADSGILKHTVSIGYSVMASPYAAGNIVYVHARNNYVYAIDVQSENIIWEFTSDIK